MVGGGCSGGKLTWVLTTLLLILQAQRLTSSPPHLQSFFSTRLFNWYASDGEEVLSPYIWVYPAVTVGLTVVVFACWYVWTITMRNRGYRDVNQEQEKAEV